MSYVCMLTCYWKWIGDKHKAGSPLEILGQCHKIPMHISHSADRQYCADNSAEKWARMKAAFDNYKKEADNIFFPILDIQMNWDSKFFSSWYDSQWGRLLWTSIKRVLWYIWPYKVNEWRSVAGQMYHKESFNPFIPLCSSQWRRKNNQLKTSFPVSGHVCYYI